MVANMEHPKTVQKESVIKLWKLEPNNGLLSNRSEDEAYLSHFNDKIYVIFIPKKGSVNITTSAGANYIIRYLSINSGEWLDKEKEVISPTNETNIETPDENGWLVILSKI